MAFHLSAGQIRTLGSSSVSVLLGRCRRIHVPLDPFPLWSGRCDPLPLIARCPPVLFWVRLLYDARRAVTRCLGRLSLLSAPRRDLSESSRLVGRRVVHRSEEHTSELQSLAYLVCRLLLEKKKKYKLSRLRSFYITTV